MASSHTRLEFRPFTLFNPASLQCKWTAPHKGPFQKIGVIPSMSYCGGERQIGPITSIHIIASCSCQMSECVFSKSYFMPTTESRLSINHSDLTSGSHTQELIKWTPFGTRGSHRGRQKGAEKLVVRIRISQERL